MLSDELEKGPSVTDRSSDFSVKIYGAGSIGNHYAYALRRRSWKVRVFDTDQQALIRMKKKIYPNRYGEWDKNIDLINKDDENYYDLIIIGTPPDTHLKIANKVLAKSPPKVLHVEKPFCIAGDGHKR